MKNRYGDEYSFELIGENTYKFVGNPKFARYGGKDYAESIDMNDLGFFDPEGGPFISEGFKIDKKPVKRIFIENETICFEV